MRKSGVLMHISSLPSPYGIGSMGREAREFVDFLKEAGQSYWQILPICPTSYGDSPYQSFSSNAGNPYFLDLENLEQMGLIFREEYEGIDWESEPDDINYGVLYREYYPVLKKASERFFKKTPPDFDAFCEKNRFWLEDYALFMSLKDAYNGISWQEWPWELKNRSPKALEEAEKKYGQDVRFWKMAQYLFFRQWKELRSYANERGIKIIGDLPIYVSLDSVDVWAHPELFWLDENKRPIEVAGCPPDGFSAGGQLWGNPLFRWEYMEKDGYPWWTGRIDYQCSIYDVLRIDHFRGFDSYYAIPYGHRDASLGCWKKGPGIGFFKAVEQQIGKRPIIAEDLGFLTDSVKDMLAESGFPGMKVLEFAFDAREKGTSEYYPHRYTENCVAYIGTHDNDTALGWLSSAAPEDAALAKEYLRLTKEEGYHWGMMRTLWGSPAGIVIVQAQDLLGLGSESRMNTPSTVGKNWRWRARPGSFTDGLARKVRRDVELYERIN